MMTQAQAMQLASELYRAFDDLCGGGDRVADRLLLLAQLIEANEQTPGGIGDISVCVTALTADLNEAAARARLRIVK